MIAPVAIGKRRVGPGEPCYVIAEAGVNHNGDLDLARRLIDAAAEAGADAVKFQSFVTEDLIVPSAPKAGYQRQTTSGGETQLQMLKALELGPDAHAQLRDHCEARGVHYLCTPYEGASVEMLDRLGVVAYKIASTDVTNGPFLRHVASKGRPILLSTGMATLAEVEEAVAAVSAAGARERTVLLQCTSEYPAPMEEVNLRAMATLESAFRLPVGFSDHTPGVGASPWAAALGACVVEKHFTLDRSLPGPDHRASVEPEELRQLVGAIRDVEKALGDGIKRPMPSEARNKPFMQKSVVARRDLPPGHVLAAEDLACKRPGTGLAPSWVDRLVGKRLARGLARDQRVGLGDVEWEAP